ncbi:MAG: BrnA antitoxin family protein [Xanthobacteraceae bacterium]
MVRGGTRHPPKKKAISIRVDEDVLNFFKQQGTGYQRRINAVLRSYMEQKKPRPNARKLRSSTTPHQNSAPPHTASLRCSASSQLKVR